MVPVSRTFVPPGGVPHKVTDGESWVTLAAKAGMDPWALIRFNYPTLPLNNADAALEVNWYLQEYVKCVVLTRDEKNYCFSSSADPGKIYLPAPKIQINYWRSDLLLPYIYREMVTNAQSPEVKELQTLNGVSVGAIALGGIPLAPVVAAGARTAALLKWRDLVRGGAKWDHKKRIKDMLALKKGDFHFPIRGDPDHEYFYDFWSNIHFGYVGSAAGFTGWELQKGAAMGGAAGTNDDIDVETVQIGIDLWEKHKLNLTQEQLRQEILSRTAKMLDIQNTPAYIEAQKSGTDENFKHITGIQDGQ